MDPRFRGDDDAGRCAASWLRLLGLGLVSEKPPQRLLHLDLILIGKPAELAAAQAMIECE